MTDAPAADLTAWALAATVTGTRQVGAASTKLVLIALCRHANADRVADPSAATLSTDLGGLDRRGIRHALAALQARGLIEPTDAKTPGHSTPWRILAGYPATPDLAGYPANSGSTDLAGYPAQVASAEKPTPTIDDDPEPSQYCALHPYGTANPCRACADARKDLHRWRAQHRAPRSRKRPPAVQLRTVDGRQVCADGRHRPMPDGTCMNCEIRPLDLAQQTLIPQDLEGAPV